MEKYPQFEEKFIKDEKGCWNWIGTKNSKNYGLLRFKNKSYFAHRYSYELFVGKIPEGLVIDHLCNNPSCINPEHLRVVTIGENVMRSEIASAAINSRKKECKYGHPLSGDNLRIVHKNGKTWRQCRKCQYRWTVEWRTVNIERSHAMAKKYREAKKRRDAKKLIN